jgi:hypothetical protein
LATGAGILNATATASGSGISSATGTGITLGQATAAGAGSINATGMAFVAAQSTAQGIGSATASGAGLGIGGASTSGAGNAAALSFYFQTTQSTLVPDADNIDGGWTNELGGTSLFPSIDELQPNVTDYIISSQGPLADVCKVQLSNPAGAIQYPMSVFYQFGSQGSGSTINLQVRLMQGTTPIATWNHTNVPNNLQIVEQVLTAPQFASITDATQLFLEFTATSP